ncbi:MAG: dihydrodipicolinate synthase family protein [Candidatus Hydrogenedentes bacterium]|nr:dihydrodipicolinate synthase family protein [Candidatus Hydrogenedentota bacterium]
MEKQLLELRGIVTVLNTPFTEDDRIDVPSLRKNVRLALAAGVAGFLVPAMAGEVDKLSEAERELLVQTVLAEVNGRVPVIGGASAPTEGARLRATESLIRLGCPGVLVSIPYENDRQYESAVRAVAELHPPFLMLQDWDSHGYGVPVPLIARLFQEIPEFRCLKIEVVPAGPKYTEVLEATQGRLHVSGGWAVMQMIEALDRGVHAFMPTGMHEIYTRIYDLYQRGNRDAAQSLFREVLPVLAFSNQHLDISIHFFKRLLHAQGIYTGPRVRPPIRPFDPVHEQTTRELIAYVQELLRDIGRKSSRL